jgi:hypothetical protein
VRETVREADLEPVRRRVFFFDTDELALLDSDGRLRSSPQAANRHTQKRKQDEFAGGSSMYLARASRL